ncbi:glycosyltransferase family protein [Trifolium repens]|nr:glycosyltransferase family protein [Trifolium repens]
MLSQESWYMVDHAEDEFMVIACDGIWLIFFQVLGFCLLGLLSHFSLRHLLLSLMSCFRMQCEDHHNLLLLGPFIDS